MLKVMTSCAMETFLPLATALLAKIILANTL